MDWLDRAGRLPGKALAVGLVLWQRAGVMKKRTVAVCQARIRTFGLKEDSFRRGIGQLERASLIRVVRRPGRGILVTLLEVRGDTGTVRATSESLQATDPVRADQAGRGF